MKVEEKKLKNGAKIIGVKMPGANSVMISFGFRTGSRTETDDIAGISHFLEHMIFKGSKKYPSSEIISKTLDGIGAQQNAYTGKELTVYYVKTSKENFDVALDIVGDMVTRPTLPSKEINKEKGTILEELKLSNDNPMKDIFNRIESVLFGNNEMGRDILGHIKSIKDTDQTKLRAYFKKYYNGSNCQVVITGDVPKDYQKKVAGYASRLPKGIPNTWEKVNYNKKHLECRNKAIEQANIGLAIPGFDIHSDKQYPLQVISNILGGYMSSRLFTEIREKKGWAYRIASYLEVSVDWGYLGIFGGVKKDKAIDSLKIIIKEVSQFADTVTDEEVNRAIENIKGISALKYDDVEEIGNYVIIHSLLSGTVRTPQEMVKRISKVTKNEVVSVSREIFKKENIHLAVIGPFPDKKKFAKILDQ